MLLLFFKSARVVSLDVLKKHLEEKIFPRLKNKRFTILYFHTGVQRSQNFPGIAALRSIYDAIPAAVKANLEAVYFVHPDLQARLFLATLGRIFFTSEYDFLTFFLLSISLFHYILLLNILEHTNNFVLSKYGRPYDR